MKSYDIFYDLAIIIVAAKLCGLICRKLNIPMVVGQILAGLIVGPCLLNLVNESTVISIIAEIGVVMLMFMAGLTTDLKELLKTGPVAFLLACVGVLVPLCGGYLLYSCFYGFAPTGSDSFYTAVFIGVIMTATSVSITVETLRELGKLQGKVGTTILSAAIIDDVIGIIVLTFVIGFKTPGSKPVSVIVNTVAFFGFAILVGFGFYYLFKFLDTRYAHSRRIPIFGFVLCLVLAYCAEEFFGIADITGAYIAGIILCNIKDSEYIEEKIDISSYMLFGPVFFASIGLKTSFDGITVSIFLFSLCFVLVALITKVVGCGITAKLCHFNSVDSLKIGIGMMTRGEVALIVAQKGLSVGLLDSVYFPSVILLIIVSSIATPILLKLLFSKEEEVACEV
ncbi:MAG: cation:proton antiporter [Lachnospiraceae bacterium]